MSISSGVLHSGKIYDRSQNGHFAGEKYTFANI